MKKKILIGLVVLSVGAWVIISWNLSSMIMVPNPHVCSKKHFVYCGDPSEQGIPFTKITLKTSDHFTLKGWFMPGTNQGKTVLIVHGRGATRREGMRMARPLHDAGYNLLTMDLRNCGESDKSFCSMGFHEKKDVAAAVDYLINKKKMTRLGVLAFSMGAATSIIAMAEDSRIQVGVFEAPFADLEDVLLFGAKKVVGFRPLLFASSALLFFEWRGNLDTSRMNPVDRIASISPRPVYLIHGEFDQEVPLEHGKRLFETAKEPKQFWLVPKGPHVECWQIDREKAEKSIVQFYNRYL